MIDTMLRFAAGLIDAGDAGLPEAGADQGAVDTIMTEIYIAVGAIAFILLLIAALRYVTAQGEPQKLTQAKNMILYTLIGLVIAGLAGVIVNYVLRST